ncbi:PP2C family protein-serine/threonine phosphatase [Rhodoflexus sp.]
MNIRIAPPLAFHELGQRSNNEDYIFPTVGTATAADRLFIVCDGVGGAAKGEVASRLACESISRFFAKHCTGVSDAALVQQAVAAAQEMIDSYIAAHSEAEGMATTLTLLHLHAQGATVAHIGDSRVYHIRKDNIIHKTSDHSMVNEWVSLGIITPEEAINHPSRNVITRVLHSTAISKVKADVQVITDLQAGDYFMLCTDGVLENLSDAQLLQILQKDATHSEKMEEIRRKGLSGSRDNFSAYLIAIEQVTDDETPIPPQKEKVSFFKK